MAVFTRREATLWVVLVVTSLTAKSVFSQGLSTGLSLPTFVVTSNEEIQYDSSHTFSISASNVARPESIYLQLLTGEFNDVVLDETTLVFSQDGVQTWTVVVDSNRMLTHDNRVDLRAQHGRATEWIRNIPVNSLSGYIMIQTDKVIYTPRQTVMYRIIALDHDQRFAPWPIIVDIKNQDLITLERHNHQTAREAFTGRNFSLPREALPGMWTIEAYFQGKVLTRRSVTFEVEEYVLPTFKADVTVSQNVIAQSTNWLQFSTQAVYAYGQPVHGTAEMRLGIVRTDRLVTGRPTYIPFPQTYRGTLDSNGQWNKTIAVDDLRSHPSWFPRDGSRLYVTVNVTEGGTNENVTAVNMGTYFANPYYRITFSDSKKFFKPGFPYTLVVNVKAANGEAASQIPIYVVMEMKNAEGEYLPGGYDDMEILDAAGRMRKTVQVPEDADTINVDVLTLDTRVLDWARESFGVNKFQSPSNQYLHLDRHGDSTDRIDISFTPPATSWLGVLEHITVLVFSRGSLIHTASVPRTSSGRQTIQLPPEVMRAAAPYARVLAYFYTRSYGRGSSSDIVSDSFYFDTSDVCMDELRLRRLDDFGFGAPPPMAPKQRAEFQVYGAPNMTVGLLAVNKAVYFLRDERSLTRDKMFNILGEPDRGRGIGDGRDTEKIFEFSGLKYLKLTEARESPLPIAGEIFEVNLNFFPEIRRRTDARTPSGLQDEDEVAIPMDQVRRYFPESWLFTEITIPSAGHVSQEFVLPDSITTWAFTAVGVGQNGGVCVSRPLDMVAFKPFFAQVRLPYKAVRLEEVMIHIGIYNYRHFDINVTVTVRGNEGLCFSEGVGGQRMFRYHATLQSRRTNSETLRVIPLVAGSVSLMVDVRSRNGQERDIVERTLHVVAEGRRVTKAITFPLDPSGRHSSHHTPSARGRIQYTSTATVTNRINTNRKKQRTEIDLYMPEEIIQGTERCQISACGDLMGDIIKHSVLEGDTLFAQSVLDAEEAIGNLAPAVHALLYLNQSHRMTSHVEAKGQRYVRDGVARLLSYRGQDGSFRLTAQSPPATWLTALMLKTLCQAERVTYVDHVNLIDLGFSWLLAQSNHMADGMEELDQRLARPSREYDLMLMAEVLIAQLECEAGSSGPETGRRREDMELVHASLLGNLVLSLEDALVPDMEQMPLVLAKTCYALTLNNPRDEYTLEAVQMLKDMRRTTADDLIYWAVSSEEEPPQRPFWYHSGSRASSVEATAYALLVFLRQQQAAASRQWQDEEEEGDPLPDWGISLDAIAGWLIQKRNSRGAFIGAMDTAAATQALSEYSLAKHGLDEINLHCNVTTSPTQNYTHTFDFNEENAITPRALTDVPVGRQLHVETRGTGLGQMQVVVDYNVPVEANANCRYNVTITRHAASPSWLRESGNNLCRYCNMDCDGEGESRSRRSISASRASICLQVCLRSTDDSDSGRTLLEIEMLSGFQPYKSDLEQIYGRRDSLSLRHLRWDNERTAVIMTFDQVPHDRSTCVSFRALERNDVRRRNPAMVTVRAHEDPEPTCVESYDPDIPEMNLAVYCANNQESNQGQCRCFSGICARCISNIQSPSLADIRELACNSRYVYKIRQTSVNTSSDWVDIDAEVISTEKAGDYQETSIQLVTPVNCPCPRTFQLRTPLYFFGSHVDVFVDRANSRRRTYVADETTTFVSENYNDRTGQYLRLATQSCPP